MIKTIRRIVSLIVLVVGIGLLTWGTVRNGRQAMTQSITPTEMQLPGNRAGTIPTLLEYRQVRLDWPSIMRIGDQSEATLVFEPAASEILAPIPQGEFSDVYSQYNLMAEGRFEVAGMQVDPAGPVRESLLKNQTIKLKWQISAQQAGNYTGTVWLLLRFLPLDGGPAEEVPILVHQLNLDATSLLGLSGPVARLLGGLGIVVGLALSYDVMIGIIKKINQEGH